MAEMMDCMVSYFSVNAAVRQPLHRLELEGSVAPIPAAHHQRPLVVRIDQPDQVAQNDPVLVAQARAREGHRRARVCCITDKRERSWSALRHRESQHLCNEPESGNREVAVEGERKADARALHDDEARCVHGRELVQVSITTGTEV